MINNENGDIRNNDSELVMCMTNEVEKMNNEMIRVKNVSI